MTVDLFAGVAVHDHDLAVPWFEQLLGTPATFQAHETESVWILAEHRSVYVVQQPDRAGHALVTLMVTGLDSFMAAASGRGIEPSEIEEYDNGVRKAVYRDPDGNEIGVGEVP